MKQRTWKHLVCVGVTAAILLGQLGCSGGESPAPASPAAPGATPAGVTSPTPAAPAAAGNPAAPTPTAATPAATPDQVSTAATPAPAAEPAPTPRPPLVYTVPAGSRISVYTATTLSTKTSKAGDNFVASLAEPLVVDGHTVAKKGANVEGSVVSTDPGGRVKGVASMAVSLQRLTLADGRAVAISTNSYSQQARTTKKKDAKKIGIGAGAGAIIGAIAGGGKGAAIGAGVGGGAGTGVVLATRGEPATIPSESRLSFTLKSPVKMTVQ